MLMINYLCTKIKYYNILCFKASCVQTKAHRSKNHGVVGIQGIVINLWEMFWFTIR